MTANSSRTAGRHFLQIPGPTPVPDRILRAMDMPVLDHRGPEFQKLGRQERLEGAQGRVELHRLELRERLALHDTAVVGKRAVKTRVQRAQTGHHLLAQFFSGE